MKRTTIFLDEALEYDLKALARRRGQPVAAVVREAVAEYVVAAKQAGATSLSFVAAGASGHDDTAERHEDLLWQEAATPHQEAPGMTSGKQRRRRISRRKARAGEGSR